MASNKEIVNGQCLCGSVRFHLTLPSKWCAHCHCSMCRAAHGAGYITWVGIEADRFSLDAGQQQLTWFKSSPEAERGFCSNCGSTMFFRSEKWQGEVHVTLGNLTGDIDRKPQANAFHNTHVDWMPIDDSLKIFNG